MGGGEVASSAGIVSRHMVDAFNCNPSQALVGLNAIMQLLHMQQHVNHILKMIFNPSITQYAIHENTPTQLLNLSQAY